jgi:uncharacterized glyoxalase superfamily protein PhnB
MSNTYELVANAEIKLGHSVIIVDDGVDDEYRIEIARPADQGKTLTLRLSVTECEALLQCLMDAVG